MRDEKYLSSHAINDASKLLILTLRVQTAPQIFRWILGRKALTAEARGLVVESRQRWEVTTSTTAHRHTYKCKRELPAGPWFDLLSS